ncbi:metastasis-associated in colon cancer protein 1 [Brachionichthys hirsutus]|uniref:metastasis-associated in colon cancer protein 1 n=1 Tax=Brachionichthys hirsutus TaxID=412623 RepID=UPI00360473BC
MAATKVKSIHHAGSLMRSKSEGNLIDLDDSFSASLNLKGGAQIAQQEAAVSAKAKNPFWNALSASNPFLLDIVDNSPREPISNISNTEPDKGKLLDTNNEDVISTSSDEGNISNLLEKQNPTNSPGRWKSASDILDDYTVKAPKKEESLRSPGQILNPDFEWLKNDRDAYKMAWLSHRQLTRSCLDLNLMSQSPGWAQTQATGFQVIRKIGPLGGSVKLPDSEISISIPQGHVPPGEIQEVTLKAMLDPPPGLNNNYVTTMSPLLEVVLSNINTKEFISLAIKLSGKVKRDPSGLVATNVVGLVSNKREGPYLQVDNCHISKNIMQMKLKDLKTHFYVIAVAEASEIKPPATSVWDYLERQITVAVYGPRYIHPSFKVVLVVCCHEDVPIKLPFSAVSRGSKNLPPLVLQLWGKHGFKPHKVNDLHFGISITESVFKIRPEDKVKEARQSHLKIRTVLHLPVTLSCANNAEMASFQLDVQVKESNAATVAHFRVSSPTAAPIRSEKRVLGQSEKCNEVTVAAPIPEETIPVSSKFKDRPVHVQWYGVALKTVLRQPHVEYLLEYFKGDTMSFLSKDTVKSVGNSKVKEWYIGFLRGRTGLVHCRNVKLITRDQVIDFTGIQITTETLLDNMTLPFNRLTYMYSAIQTLVTEHIADWRAFADALGYSNLSLDTIIRRPAETEADKVACVLEKLKEDCHTEKSRRKFLHELIAGLLKMDAMNLVAQLIQNTVILSTAVELGVRWKELAEKTGKLSSSQISGYEAPHRGRNGEVAPQSLWKPAYDFLHFWSLRYGDSYRFMIQDLHLNLDKMKNPATRQWRQLTGALITVNCLDIFCASAYPNS